MKTAPEDKALFDAIYKSFLSQKETEERERKIFIDSIKKITDGKGFTLITTKNKL